jgi:hypothetical protein
VSGVSDRSDDAVAIAGTVQQVSEAPYWQEDGGPVNCLGLLRQ